tara:strand:+ start:54864 stop:56357 length:1494 start_codon:yes stop_codon:yes gene_type:complete
MNRPALLLMSLIAAACHSKSSPAPELKVLELQPAPGTTSRPVEVAVVIDEDVDPASVALDQIVVASVVRDLAGVTSYDVGARTVRWLPSAALPRGARLRATLRSGMRALGGGAPLPEATWSFTVEGFAFEEPLALPVVTAGVDVLASVGMDPTTGIALVATGVDVWEIGENSQSHETFPFVPTSGGATHGGAVFGAALGLDFVVRAAVRGSGGWLQDEIPGSPFVTSGWAGGGGAGDAFLVHSLVQNLPVWASTTYAWLGNGLIQCGHQSGYYSPSQLTYCAALSPRTAVTWSVPVSGIGDATYSLVDFRQTPAQTLATWMKPDGFVVAGRDGAAFLAYRLGGEAGFEVERRSQEGTVTGSVALPVNSIVMMPGSGAGAALGWGSTSQAFTVRLDRSATAATPRYLPTSTVPLGASYYADTGTIWLLSREPDAAVGTDALVMWQQHPDQEWQGPTTLLPAVADRVLGTPSMGVDDAGRVVIAVPRTMPNEVVVLRAR